VAVGAAAAGGGCGAGWEAIVAVFADHSDFAVVATASTCFSIASFANSLVVSWMGMSLVVLLLNLNILFIIIVVSVVIQPNPASKRPKPAQMNQNQLQMRPNPTERHQQRRRNLAQEFHPSPAQTLGLPQFSNGIHVCERLDHFGLFVGEFVMMREIQSVESGFGFDGGCGGGNGDVCVVGEIPHGFGLGVIEEDVVG